MIGSRACRMPMDRHFASLRGSPGLLWDSLPARCISTRQQRLRNPDCRPRRAGETSCFAISDDLFASCGRKKRRLWDPQTGAQLWTAAVKDLVLSTSFAQHDGAVILATRANKMVSFDTRTGAQLPDWAFFDMNENEDENMVNPSLVINPNPDELAAAYQDGDLVVFNPFDGRQIADVETSAHVLVASPDGRTLATGDGNGMIQLFNFKTLKLLYRVYMYDDDIRTIAFASNSLRFFDIGSNLCDIWEPTVLVRNRDPDDTISEPYSDEVPRPALLVDYRSGNNDLTITAICEHSSGNWIFTGQ